MNNKQTFLPLLLSSFVALPTPAIAQITPDNTLGAENSRLTPNVLINGANADKIEGGAQRGSNLFHSFSQFNIDDGQRVYFGNPNGVENILTRVTGGNASNIFGTLGVDGAANLFLINPNGILLGQNASLDIRGSFVGTTANAVQFGNQDFSATNPQAPPLLTVQPSGLLFNQINQNAAIQNNSIAPAGTDPAGFDVFGLRVSDGKSLLLVGGNVNMDGGQLNAYGGRVELGGLAAPGSINLLFDGDNLKLRFPENVTRADVLLTNQAYVYVEANGGGDIAINARNIGILQGSQLSAGIGQGLGTPETVAGDITLNATGEIKVAGAESRVGNIVSFDSQGNGGNITINSGSFLLRDDARLRASTYGKGDAGNVQVTATDAVSLAVNALILSTVEAGGMGNSGNIDINAATLTLLDGAQLITITREASDTQPPGKGDAGDINLQVSGVVDIAGERDTFPTGLFSEVQTGTQGNGGNITIDAGSFQLRDGAQLSASVEAGGVGKGGNIDINAASLSLSGGAQMYTVTSGQGNAGFIKINVSDLMSLDGSNGIFGSGVFSSVEDLGTGKSGNINIQTKMLSVTNAAAIVASARGKGDAGSIQINASDSINISGNNLDTGYSSGIFAFTLPKSTGQGGSIKIDTSNLRLSEGGVLDVRTRNERQGGSIAVNADTVELLNGGGILSTTSGSGSAGRINVNAREKLIIDGFDRTFNDRIIKVGEEPFFNYFISTDSASSILVRSESQGVTGDIEVNSPRITLDNQGTLNANSASGSGGNINLTSDLLLLRRGTQISTNAGTTQQGGDGGNIDINSKFIVAFPQKNSDITANAFSGNGGNINIRTQGIFGIEARPKPSDRTNDITASSELGVQGQINIIQPDVQPTEAVIELPDQIVDASDQIGQNCPRGRNAKRLGEFVVSGRGSLPPNSLQPLNGTTTIAPLATLDGDLPNTSSAPIAIPSPPTQIIEAQGWLKTPDGKIMLVASAPTATPSSSTASVCPVSR
ncbi:S-layer family protein [Plectonema cf. radiosum LEGE 06105]|uniref:S-layer family protein n=1 Tax=Plectonema cf. radiosum LEGE 06105 TaxID=945769 RepID=A0A8J7F8P3_9CYAN|nr:S-layer family protein [Plectonema radiosum]MBE9216873.1 S-layer family protein [Plectonema cf. radiosum LEGE 06105]